MQAKRLSVVLIIVFILSASLPSYAFDFALWDNILKNNVKRTASSGITYTGFHYGGILDSREFDRLLSDIESFSPDKLKERDEIISFWINIYNIFAVRLIRDNYPVKGIKDIGGIFSPVWKMVAGKVGGKPYSLDEIEHKMLRPMAEPEVHFALVCASVSCPDLMLEAYSASKLKEQLKSRTEEFLKNREKGMRIEFSEKTIYLSKIFDWYKKDFEGRGGAVNFIKGYLKDIQRIPADFSVKYIPYNWELNDVR